MKVVFVIALLGIGVLGYWVGLRNGHNQEHQNKIAMPGALAATLEEQEKCAKQAHEVFKLGGWDKKLTTDFSNHYNVQLNRCFVEIDNDEYPWTHRIFSDAFEGGVYAAYSWRVDENKKYWEVPPIECWVNDASGKKQQCKSNEEFDALLKPYLTK